MTAQRLLHLVLLPIKKNLDLFSFIYLSNVILHIISRYAFFACIGKSVILSFLIIIDAYAFCTIASLGGKHLKRVIYAVVGFILFVEYFLLINFHTLISIKTFTLVAQTNSEESSEFVNMCLSSTNTWWSILLFASVSVLTSVAIPRLIIFLNARHSELTIWIKKKATISLSLFIFIFCVSCYTKLYENEPIIKSVYCRLTSQTTLPRYRNYHSSGWQRLVSFSEIIIKNQDDTKKLLASVQSSTVDSCSFTSPTVILIIGESYNKYHTPIYNEHSLYTTPKLIKRIKNGNVIPYNDVVSPYNLTANVFVQLFSVSSCETNAYWYDYTLFSAIYKKAGYEVTLITNQFIKQSKDFWDAIGGSIFNTKGLDSLQLDFRNEKGFGHDINIIKEYQALQTEGAKPRLIIFHLYGQHALYKARHPEDYTPIAKEDIKLEYNDSEQARDIAWHYANATHYNDFVVDSIFKLFDDTETVGIYLSDHGEEVYDFRDFYHRSHEDPSYYNIAKYEYEVPFMFYATDKYQAAHPEIMQQIREAKDRPFMTDDLPQVMLYLAGIKQKDYDETRNVLSPNFNTKRKRLLNDKYDFDAIRAASKEQ